MPEVATVKEVLNKLEAQDYKCALTGWELSPDNFSLEHIIPIAKGGGDSIDNLNPVHPLVNTAKGTMGQDEFIEMCVAVANHCMAKTQATL